MCVCVCVDLSFVIAVANERSHAYGPEYGVCAWEWAMSEEVPMGKTTVCVCAWEWAMSCDPGYDMSRVTVAAKARRST